MKQILTLWQLIQAAKAKRSICFADPSRRPMPASFVASMQGFLIHRMIESGIYLYEPQSKKGKPTFEQVVRYRPRERTTR